MAELDGMNFRSNEILIWKVVERELFYVMNYFRMVQNAFTSPYVSNCLLNEHFPVPPNPNPYLSVPEQILKAFFMNYEYTTIHSFC